MDDFLRVMDPNRNGFTHAMDPNQNGFVHAMDPAQNRVKAWADGAFNRESINQQNTILKGMFSTNKNDQEQGQEAMLDGNAWHSGIYDHPVDKPNKYDSKYNANPKLPDAPKPPTTPTSNSTYYLYIGGALVVLFVLFKN
jgi:hypothetical protein